MVSGSNDQHVTPLYQLYFAILEIQVQYACSHLQHSGIQQSHSILLYHDWAWQSQAKGWYHYPCACETLQTLSSAAAKGGSSKMCKCSLKQCSMWVTWMCSLLKNSLSKAASSAMICLACWETFFSPSIFWHVLGPSMSVLFTWVRMYLERWGTPGDSAAWLQRTWTTPFVLLSNVKVVASCKVSSNWTSGEKHVSSLLVVYVELLWEIHAHFDLVQRKGLWSHWVMTELQ